MTELLYQHDAYLARFEATVVDALADGVVLDRTAFFPGGGGQPADTGTLSWAGGQAGVTGLTWRDGVLVHGIDGAGPPPGATVTGQLDWERRYAHMRTHTALHTLGGVIARDHGALITGGNFDGLKARMDFELPSMSADLAATVEAALRAEVAADRPVRVDFVSPDELAARADLIRTKTNLVPQGLDIVRVIEIDGLDRQADGGTHVRSTGEVGGVRVVKHESKGKANKRLRIELDPAPPAAPGP
jgi:misacylated tRNA(Ala) deacylase